MDETNKYIEKDGVMRPCDIYMEFSKNKFHWLDEDAYEEYWGTYRIGEDGSFYIKTKEGYYDGEKMPDDPKERQIGYYYNGMLLYKVKRKKNGNCVILDNYYKIEGNRFYERKFGRNKRKESLYVEKGEVRIDNNMYMLFKYGEKRPEVCYYLVEDQWFEVNFIKK